MRADAREKYLPKRKRDRKGIGLCLSGGGYRAALFHLGALRRLNELGVLAKVDTVSSVSGGSIVAALLADELDPWPSDPLTDDVWESGFATRLRVLTRRNIRTLWVLRRLATLRWFDSTVAVRTLARRYRRTFRDRPLADLQAPPRFVFCATDMAFGVNWVAERSRVGDYQAGYVKPPPAEWTVSLAVAASSCFPPVFDPLPIGLSPSQLRDGEAKDHPNHPELVKRLRLTDGGVYDNMALEPVWKGHETVLVSDGGATFDFAPDRGFPRRLARYLTVQGNQAGALRKRWLIASYLTGEMGGAYWGIGSAATSYPDLPASGDAYTESLVKEIISEVRTDLDCFSPAEQAVLENHGYLLADRAVRNHAPGLVSQSRPPSPPHGDYLDEERVRRELASSHRRRILGRWHWMPAW